MSDVLFWEQRCKSDDPFLEPTLPPAFYHPSLPKALTKEESQIKLSSEKLRHEEDKENIDKRQLTPQETEFMLKTNTLLAKELPTRDTPSPRDTSSKFEESWPTSERPSTIESPPETSALRDEKNGENISRTSSASTRSKSDSKIQMKEFNLSSLLKRESSVSSSHQGDKIQSSHILSHHDSRMKTAPSSTQHDSVLASMLQGKSLYSQVTLLQSELDHILEQGTCFRENKDPQRWYIHRFRHSAPQSREERTAKGQSMAAKELWWLSPPTRDVSATGSSGTLSHTSSRTVAKHPKVPPASRGLSDSTASSSSFYSKDKRSFGINRGSNIPTRDRRHGTVPSKKITKGRGLSPPPSRPDDVPSSSTPVMDAETLLLQEKAQHLLEISESSLSSDPMVSSEGIGSSPSLPSRDEKLYIPPEDISPIKEKDTVEGFIRDPSQIHSRPQKNLRPEDDILHQWRLRRKMELAKQGGVLNRGQDHLLAGRERTRRENGVPSSQQYDPTLEAFRSQLRQSHLSDRKSQDNLHKESHMSSPVVRTRGTDPIPQTASTQTGTEEERSQSQKLGSVKSGQERNLHPSLGIRQADNTTARNQGYDGDGLPFNRVEQQPFAVAGSPPRVEMKQVPIASPNKDNVRKEGYNVPPHWHLSCDIIPCQQGNVPHSHSEDEFTRKQQGWKRTEIESSTKDEDQLGEGKREAVEESERLRNDCEMGVVKDDDDDDRTCERRDLREIRENKNMQLRGKNRDEAKNEQKQGYSQRREQLQKKSGSSQKSGIPRPQQRVGSVRTDRKSVKRGSKGIVPLYQPERKHKEISKDGAMVRMNDRTEKTSPGSSSDTEPFTDISAEEDRGREGVEGSKQKSMQLQSAIGQVVIRRLFDADSPKVPKTPSPAQSKPASQASHSEASGRREESTSDSDEFSDDNLLQMLRQKRALYEKQLQRIDEAIASKVQAR